jgi:hypothetical protein
MRRSDNVVEVYVLAREEREGQTNYQKVNMELVVVSIVLKKAQALSDYCAH